MSFEIQTGQMEHLVPTLTPDGLEQMRNMLKRMDTIANVSHELMSNNFLEDITKVEAKTSAKTLAHLT